MEDLLRQIIEKIDRVESKIDRIESKLDATMEQTALISEFRTETKQLMEEIKLHLKHNTLKLAETEKDVFVLKNKQNH